MGSSVCITHLFLHLLSVIENVVPDVLDLLYKSFVLQLTDFFRCGTFDFFLIIPFRLISPVLSVLAECECFFVYFKEFFGNALFNRSHPFLGCEVKIF